jgi:hypothetical protein
MSVKPALGPDARREEDARRMRALGVVALALAAYVAWLVPFGRIVTDDTYIHLVYARHFRDGLGLLFNIGEPVYGTTSPLWSLGLGFLGRTGLGLLPLAQGLSMLFGGCAVVAFALFLRRFVDAAVDEFGYGARRAELAWALGVLAFATDAWLVRWSASGMESALATFLVCAGFAAYVKRRPWGQVVVAPAAWWSVAALVRPEAALLVLLLVVRVLLARGPWSRRLERAGRALLPAALVAGPWLAYALVTYGRLLPATLAAKTAGGVGLPVFAEFLVRQAKSLAGARALEMVVLVALLPALFARVVANRAEHFVPALFLVGLPLLYAARGVPVISRYLLVVAPLVVAYAWAGLAWAAASVRRRPAGAVAALLVAGLATVGWGASTTLRLSLPQARMFSRDLEGSLADLGRWCRARTPEGSAIATPDIGVVGWYAERPIVDLGGLVTPAITPLLARFGDDDLVRNLRFEGLVRPAYLIDRANLPARLLAQSPYAPCLTPLRVARVRARGIQHPETAYYTLYRIDWLEFDRLHGGEREAVVTGE